VAALAFVALVALAVAILLAYRAGIARARRDVPAMTADAPSDARIDVAAAASSSPPASSIETNAAPPHPVHREAFAERAQLAAFADDRAQLFAALADARAETAQWRQIVVDIERNAPPPLLDAPNTPDDLKLIVGIGPAIERVLYRSGIATYRQIARLSEREIDAIERTLAEFPGRIRRDGWVAQARSLHLAKYGTNP
jgi:NADH-quinone oxidoreductase subunit E